MARQAVPAPAGQVLLPDVPNWSWHEYGVRVGFWRFHRLYERLGIRPTLALNARVCDDYARVAAAARDSGWEFMGHVWDQLPIHKNDDQGDMIHHSLDRIETFTGTRPRGWLGPGLIQTLETPELLAEAGMRYIGDWVWDDEPCTISTANGGLATMPYTLELNDIPAMIVQHHESPYWTQRCHDTSDCYYMEGTERAKITAIAVHPYVSGQPHRIAYLEQVYDYIRQHDDVVFMNGGELFDWYIQDARSRQNPT